MNGRAQQKRFAEHPSRAQSDIVPAGSTPRFHEPLFPGGDPKSRDRAYVRGSEPRFLEGDAVRGKRVIERWERAVAAGNESPMSETAAALLWSGDMGNGWILDDETGELVARVDPGWLLQWARAQSAEAEKVRPPPDATHRTASDRGFIAPGRRRAAQEPSTGK